MAENPRAQNNQPNGSGAPGPNNSPPTNNNNNNPRDPLINVRDRLFHTLFFKISLAYARSCPKPVRRVIEMMILLKAILCFLSLIYIHVAYARHPVQCLEDIKESWPRDGILRVEIMKNPPGDFTSFYLCIFHWNTLVSRVFFLFSRALYRGRILCQRARSSNIATSE